MSRIAEAFDGHTYNAPRDYARLSGQLARVRTLMSDGQWRTLSEIARCVGGTEAAVSARLRDLRKIQHGSLTIERRYVSNGLFEYRRAS